MRTRNFWIRFVIYSVISIGCCLLVIYFLGAIAMGDDLQTKERMEASSMLISILKYVLGFPLGFFYGEGTSFLDSQPLYWSMQFFNCFIQFSLLFYIFRKAKQRSQ
jgi:hypothetical protein